MSWGDYTIPWCLQSVSKPLTYGIAMDEYGADYVHSYVGQEPSGRLFNEICLDHNGIIYFILDVIVLSTTSWFFIFSETAQPTHQRRRNCHCFIN